MTEFYERAAAADALLTAIAREIPGLGLASAQILMTAALRPGMSVSELSAACGIKVGKGSRLIIDLSRMPLDVGKTSGLILLESNSDDKTKKSVRLSPNGRIKLAEIFSSLDAKASKASKATVNDAPETQSVPIYHRYHRGLLFTAMVVCDRAASVSRLHELALRWAETKGIDLEDATFSRVLISGLNLSGRNLRALYLRESVLDEADFSNCTLRQADFGDGDIRKANFKNSKMSGIGLSKCNLEKSDFSDADMSMAHVFRANLKQANLKGANLSDAELSESILRGANLDGANLTKARLIDADLSSASLIGACLQNAELRGARLDFVRLAGADLRGANLHGALIREYDMTPYRDDLWRMLDLTQTFIPTLVEQLCGGHLPEDDKPYGGNRSAKLFHILTRAGARDVPRDPNAPIERWFAMISRGDLPGDSRRDRNGKHMDSDWGHPNKGSLEYAHRYRIASGGTIAELTLRWIAQYCVARQIPVPDGAVIKP